MLWKPGATSPGPNNAEAKGRVGGGLPGKPAREREGGFLPLQAGWLPWLGRQGEERRGRDSDNKRHGERLAETKGVQRLGDIITELKLQEEERE